MTERSPLRVRLSEADAEALLKPVPISHPAGDLIRGWQRGMYPDRVVVVTGEEMRQALRLLLRYGQ
jgi:hypothetical protein